MAIPMLDFKSEDSYQKNIDRIMELERTRLVTIETNISEAEESRRTLNEIKSQFILVGDYSKKFYSLSSVFRNLKVDSSAEDVVEATADNPQLLGNELNIKVKQLATKHALSSREVSKTRPLPSSHVVFQFGEEPHSFDFEGGSLKDLVIAIEKDKKLKEKISTRIIHKNSEDDVFIMSSALEGVDNRLRVVGDSGGLFTRSLGLFRPNPPVRKALLTSEQLLEHLQASGSADAWNGQKIVLAPNQGWNMPLQGVLDFNEVENISFQFTRKDLSSGTEGDAETLQIPQRGQDAPSLDAEPEQEPFSIGALRYRIKLDGNNWSAWEVKEITSKNLFLGRVILDNFTLNLSIEGGIIDLGDLTIENKDPDKLHLIGIPEVELRRESKDKYIGRQPLIEAKNSVFEYEGVEVERDSNFVADIMDGVKIKLKKVSEQPVNLKVDYNEDLILNTLFGLLQEYNKAIEYLNIVIAPTEESLEANELEEKWKNRVGLFTGDYNLYRLKDSIRDLIGRVYSSQGDDLKLMVQLGIERLFKINNPYDIDNDKLNIDVEKFRQGLREYGTSVQRIFSYDSNGDATYDNGFAYLLDENISRYTGQVGYLSLRPQGLTEEITSTTKLKEREERRLEQREQKLNRDFGRVRGAMQEQETVGKWLEGFQNGSK